MTWHHSAGIRLAAPLCLIAGLGMISGPRRAHAGPVNPDISVIGQPFVRYTEDRDDPNRRRARLDVGETEFFFDAALNPYAHGTVIVALGEEGAELEEGFFHLTRGLPLDLALKGGKYRAGFGPMNPVHPHALPFSERPHVVSEYLPGEESFNETGLSLSRRFPVVGDFSLNASADWLQGDSFRVVEEDSGEPDTDVTRPAFLGRLSGFTLLGEQSALEFGISGAAGTSHVAAGTRTNLLGLDAKAKLWRSPEAYLVLQGEVFRLEPQQVDMETGSVISSPLGGGYVFADYNFSRRYNLGVSYERYQQLEVGRPVAQAVGAFAGLSLLEETTLFRLDWNHFRPDDREAANTLTFRIIYSMGPHRAHPF